MILELTLICSTPPLLAQAPSVATDAAPALWGGLVPGNYNVGYQRIQAPGGQVHLWYPTRDSGSPLRVRDYLADSGAKLTAFLSGVSVTASTTAKLLAAPLYGVHGAAVPATELPLILIAHGNTQDVVDQVVLSEYLASHGFAVAATPSPMIARPMQSEDQLSSLAESQADDLVGAVIAARTVVRVDTQRIAVVGHSFGARSALLLAMRGTPRLRALVSLDGGIGTSTALEQFRRAASFRMEASLPPLLHFSETLDAFMAPDVTLLRALRTASLTVESTTNLRHTHFTTWGFAAVVFPELARATRATPGTGPALRAVVEKLHEFLRDAMNRR
jgi:dienelactone hydrolase